MSLGQDIPEEQLPTGRRWSIRRVYREIISILNRVSGNRRWVEKSPQNLYCVPLLHRYCRTASFVHIVRNGGANIASLVDAGNKYEIFRARFGGQGGIDKAVRFYNSSIDITRRFSGRKRHVVVRYEDLAEEPGSALASVEALLGIEIDDGMLSYRTDGIATEKEVWKKGDSQIRLRGSKFQEVFSEDEQDFITSLMIDVETLFPRRARQW